MQFFFALALIAASILGTVHMIPIQILPGLEAEAFDVVVVGNPGVHQKDGPTPLPPPTEVDADEKHDNEEDNEEWKTEHELTEGAMGKRSIALGRSGFRPGKRSSEDLVGRLNYNGLVMKRSMAIGRLGLRPGKRSMTFGRLNFRPGKRSMAYGRQGFRPGKRSVEVADYAFQPPTPEIYFY